MKRIIIVIVLIIGVILCVDEGSSAMGKSQYAIVRTYAPLLNRPYFSHVFGGEDGKTLALDEKGLLRALETILLPGTLVVIEESFQDKNNTVYKVTTDEYPYESETGYYVDSRCVVLTDTPRPRSVQLPDADTVLERLRSAQSIHRYVWGGNVRAGIPELLQWYTPRGEISSETRGYWELAGLDCSGLLYEATDGYTPRNTSALLSYGIGLNIEGKSVAEIVSLVKPLDLIVWKGHVVIVLSQTEVIESRHKYSTAIAGHQSGVRIHSLITVLTEIMKEKKPFQSMPYDKSLQWFTIRRWLNNSQ